MNADSNSLDPYEAVLADLRAKRDQIDQAIAVITNLRGGGAPMPSSTILSGTAANDHGIVETAGMYLGMSIVDAAKKLLATRKKTMGNVEIARALQEGGLVFSGSDPVNVVGSVMTRRFNNVGDVVKLGRGIWGLKEWYPGRNFKPGAKVAAAASSEEIAEEAVDDKKPAAPHTPAVDPDPLG
jgi:hypothetical protein